MSAEKIGSDQSDDQSAIIIGILGFGGKCTDFTRETSETAPFGSHHLDWPDNLWAGLIFTWFTWIQPECWHIESCVAQLVKQCPFIRESSLVPVLVPSPSYTYYVYKNIFITFY